MLCSLPAGKSGPNWLDRLRSSKGLPVHHSDLDLEHFLSSGPTTGPNLPPPPIEAKTAYQPKESPLLPQKKKKKKKKKSNNNNKKEGEEEWLDLMGSVLAELFHMGGSQDLRARGDKKISRKQTNPRICVVSSSASDGGSCPVGARGASFATSASPPSADNSAAGAKKKSDVQMKPRNKRGISGATDSDLAAYSRNEVTVVDTSLPTWKSQKLIFRKGLVWKVRDKKSWNVCRKKRRKLGLVERLVAEKDLEQPKPSVGTKEAASREKLAPQNEGCPQNDGGVACIEALDNQNPIPRRHQFPRSSRRPAAKDTSVFRTRVIPTYRKNEASCSRIPLKGK